LRIGRLITTQEEHVTRGILIALMGIAACARPATRPAVGTPPAESAAAPLDVPAAIARIAAAGMARDLRAVYAPRDFEPVFVSPTGAPERAAAAIDALQSLDADGLPVVALERARLLLEREGATSADSLARLDVLLTRSWLDAARGLSGHRIVPVQIDSAWSLAPEPVDPVGALEQAMTQDRVVAALADFRPAHAAYEGLRGAWQRYHAIAARGGWPALGGGTALEPGASGPRVATLRTMLAAVGDLDTTRGAGDRYDDTLAAAVRRFQQRHGLAADGIVGDRTRAALNTPVEQRLRQLELNLERWRWLPRRLEAPYVMVNIPAFELRFVDTGGAVTARRVILGRPDWRTPLLAASITHIVVAPPWGVPTEIARRELVPLLRADTGYAARAGILIYPEGNGETGAVDSWAVDWSAADSAFPYRLVQLPGPANPLGRVKLVFRNAFGVYLHDTPAIELFGAPERALSHGCVRVDGAFALARELLRDRPEWTPGRLDSLAARWTTQWIRLARPVPVYLVYFTAWVDAAGDVQFRNDLYDWDTLLAASLSSFVP
jgi:murein L,D-transpeptidase YcbB/YkuD